MRERKGVSRLPPGRRSRNGGRQGCKTPGRSSPQRARTGFGSFSKATGASPSFPAGSISQHSTCLSSLISLFVAEAVCNVRSFLRCGRTLIHRLVMLEQNKYIVKKNLGRRNLDNESPREGTAGECGDRGVGQGGSSLSLARARPTEGHLGSTGRDGRAGCRRIGSLA
jgi:hypothetical protein